MADLRAAYLRGLSHGRSESDESREELADLRVAILALADEMHARGCHYRHQQGETDECNSCTAHRFESLVDEDGARALAEVKAEALREAADWWTQGGWAKTLPQGGPITKAQAVGDWLRDRAARLSGGTS